MNNRGVTLVTLTITIVLMLILASLIVTQVSPSKFTDQVKKINNTTYENIEQAKEQLNTLERFEVDMSNGVLDVASTNSTPQIQILDYGTNYVKVSLSLENYKLIDNNKVRKIEKIYFSCNLSGNTNYQLQDKTLFLNLSSSTSYTITAHAEYFNDSDQLVTRLIASQTFTTK